MRKLAFVSIVAASVLAISVDRAAADSCNTPDLFTGNPEGGTCTISCAAGAPTNVQLIGLGATVDLFCPGDPQPTDTYCGDVLGPLCLAMGVAPLTGSSCTCTAYLNSVSCLFNPIGTRCWVPNPQQAHVVINATCSC